MRSAGELGAELERALEEESVAPTRHLATRPPTSRFARKGAAAGAGAAAAAAGVGAAAANRVGRTRPRAPTAALRERLPVIGVAAFLVAFAAAVAIAALASGGR